MEQLFLSAGHGGLGLGDPDRMLMECQLVRHGIVSESREITVSEAWVKLQSKNDEVRKFWDDKLQMLASQPGKQVPVGHWRRVAVTKEFSQQHERPPTETKSGCISPIYCQTTYKT